MGILATILADAAETLEASVRDEIATRGSLDPDQCVVEFCTQEDDRVRPSHEALAGTVWEPGDPDAPVPPLDYGCRCYVRTCAKPDTHAAHFLPVLDREILSTAEAYAVYLGEVLPTWQAIWATVQAKTGTDQVAAAVVQVQKALPDADMADVRDYARMLIQAGRDGLADG